MQVVVDDRTFVVGLSELFRQEMKAYEVATLLPMAEEACDSLNLSPATALVEGYYSESCELTRYFLLIRALQRADAAALSPGSGSVAIHRLREVLTSPAMGRVEESGRLIPRTNSPFGEALRVLANWSIEDVCRQARQLVRNDDAGLLAVAAAAGDAVGLCVARESMALLADVELAEVELPDFVWMVSENVATVAERFVSALARRTGIVLPEPKAASSHLYGQAARGAGIAGRCILIGERSGNPYPYYHWYIDLQNGDPIVRDFWSNSLWTTEDIRRTPVDRRPAIGARVGASGLGNEGNDVGGVSHAVGSDGKGQLAAEGWFSRLFHRRR